MAAKLTRLTQNSGKLHLVAESSSCFRRPVRKLLDMSLYI